MNGRKARLVLLLATALASAGGCGDTRPASGSSLPREVDASAGGPGPSAGEAGAATPEPVVPGTEAAGPATPALDTAGPAPEGSPPFYGGFAYADGAGGRLLALSEPAFPEALLRGACLSGARLDVRFEHHQARGEGDDGRQVAGNFDRDGGALYRVERGTARGNETCFLLGPALLDLGPVTIPEWMSPRPCEPADSLRITTLRERPVTSCRLLRVVDETTSLLAAEFALRGDSALASLVLADPVQLTFLDFPAAREPVYGDTWRVGDGGAFHPQDFGFPLVVAAPPHRAMAVAWPAEEGESLMLVTALDGADSFREVVGAYRYWMAR